MKRALDGDIFILGKDLLPKLGDLFGQEVIILHTCQGNVEFDEFTLLLNLAIGSELLSLRYRGHFHRSDSQYGDLPIVHSSHVTPTSGTGLVHCAPAHGIEDYQVLLDHNLSSQFEEKGLLCLVGPEGTFSEQAIAQASWLDPTIGPRLIGKPVLKEGSSEVVQILRSIGHLLHEQKLHHRYPYDWKTDTPVIVT